MIEEHHYISNNFQIGITSSFLSPALAAKSGGENCWMVGLGPGGVCGTMGRTSTYCAGRIINQPMKKK